MASVKTTGYTGSEQFDNIDDALLAKHNNRTFGQKTLIFPDVAIKLPEPIPETGTGNVIIVPSSDHDGNVYYLNGNDTDIDGRY